MVETTKKLMEQIDEVTTFFVSKIDAEDIKEMDEGVLLMLKKGLKIMDTAKELSMEQAKAMDRLERIEDKLDKLLLKTES